MLICRELADARRPSGSDGVRGSIPLISTKLNKTICWRSKPEKVGLRALLAGKSIFGPLKSGDARIKQRFGEAGQACRAGKFGGHALGIVHLLRMLDTQHGEKKMPAC